MAANLSRWLKYAQAKLNSAVSSGNDELADLEARREAELADRPWLASDDPTPTLDEARARIEWEAEHAGRPDEPVSPSQSAEPAEDGTGATSDSAPPSPATTKPTMDAEVAKARFEMDQKEQESKERLAAIRAELGVDAPPDEAAPES